MCRELHEALLEAHESVRGSQMRRRILWLCVVIAVSLLIPAQGFCDGYGFYGWGRGWPTIGVPGALEELLPAFKDLEIDLRHDHFTLGYLYDSASTQEDRFGWRFNLGLDIVATKLESTSAPGGLDFGYEALSSDLYDTIGFGFATKLAYGIAIVRTDRTRVWAGPSVRLNANYVDQKAASFEEFGFSFEVDPWGIILSLGGGIEGGIRYDISTDLTIDFSTGFHYNFFGYFQDSNLKISGEPQKDDSSLFIGQEPFVFVQIALGFDFGADNESR
jgi:hypothetical protein